MYRIIYSPKVSGWVIQISSFMIFWTNINKSVYGNFNDAKAHVDNIGLDKIYRNYNDRSQLHHHHTENTPVILEPSDVLLLKKLLITFKNNNS